MRAETVHDDESVRAATGRDWSGWVSLIHAGPGADAGHTAIAAWLREEHGVDAWWAQAVTVGFERIVGLRRPGQMPDGTYSITRSRTVHRDAEEIRRLWEDDDARAGLIPGLRTVRISRAGVKLPRYAATVEDEDAGVVSLAIGAAAAGVRLAVTHEKLADAEAAERWKAFWGAWLIDLTKNP